MRRGSRWRWEHRWKWRSQGANVRFRVYFQRWLGHGCEFNGQQWWSEKGSSSWSIKVREASKRGREGNQDLWCQCKAWTKWEHYQRKDKMNAAHRGTTVLHNQKVA
jgi:hypothetical protein